MKRIFRLSVPVQVYQALMYIHLFSCIDDYDLDDNTKSKLIGSQIKDMPNLGVRIVSDLCDEDEFADTTVTVILPTQVLFDMLSRTDVSHFISSFAVKLRDGEIKPVGGVDYNKAKLPVDIVSVLALLGVTMKHIENSPQYATQEQRDERHYMALDTFKNILELLDIVFEVVVAN